MEGNLVIKFIVVTPFRGNLDWLEQTMISVETQDYRNVEHHVILDGPEYKNRYNSTDKLKITVREERKWPVWNHYHALKEIEPDKETVVVHLDGDDLFLGTKALSRIAKEYIDPDVWYTYGNYVGRSVSVCKPIKVAPRKSILQGGWCYSHPRTFRAHTIPYLKESDMLDSNGLWYTSASDAVINCPLMELAGMDRVRFIDEDLVYYREHTSNEKSNQASLRDQVRCAIECYNKTPYSRIK